MYLYTFDISKFIGVSTVFVDAESAFLLGDKYALPKLRDAGRMKLLACIHEDLTNFKRGNTSKQKDWIDWIRKSWNWAMPGAEELRIGVLNALVRASTSVIENEDFYALMREDENLHRSFLRALAKKAITKK